MAFRKLFNRLRIPAKTPAQNESGIALFMVIAAMTILSVVVSEFTYVAQVNSRMAVDSVDSIKAHYLAKTGLKISLLRLKAYQTLKNFSKKQGEGGGGGGFQLPADILEQVWSFPFIYPIPQGLPGITPMMRDEIQKFQDESNLEGKFSATIESDSNRININSLVEEFAATPEPSPSPTGGGRNPRDPNPNPSASPNVYDRAKAREAMRAQIGAMIDQKVQDDPDFADEIGNNAQVWLEEFFDNLLGWIDYTHQPQNRSGQQEVPYKRAPLFHISELNMISPMDDAMYQLFAENFTAGMSQAINVNTLQEPLLRSLFPGITDEEVVEFFKFRDSEEEDNRFKSVDDFWKYVGRAFGIFGGSSSEIDRFKESLQTRGVRMLTEEESFKIRVVAEVNSASRVIEAWVTLSEPKESRPTGRRRNPNDPDDPDAIGAPGNPGPDGVAPPPAPESSLRITFMRES